MKLKQGLSVFTSDRFALPLPAGHRFPVQKYGLLRERVEAARLGQLRVAEAISDEQLLTTHTPDYVQRMCTGAMTEREMRRIGFPWSAALVERSRRSAGATLAAARAALVDGISVNLAGGTHHAYADHGEGYCVFNDSVIAARSLQAEGLARRVVVIDLDVHQGNGTAAIAASDPAIYTFSMHGAKNYPFHKERSDLDIALDDGTGDDAYLEALEWGLGEALEQSRAELAFYLAGADPYRDDRLGRLSLSKDGLRRRSQLVLEACAGAGIAVAVSMAGGYARTITDTVDIQVDTVAVAAEWRSRF